MGKQLVGMNELILGAVKMRRISRGVNDIWGERDPRRKDKCRGLPVAIQ